MVTFVGWLSYSGQNYYGFQRQKDFPTIQGAFEDVVSTLVQQTVRISSSGRTDRGVNAVGHVVSFSLDRLPFSPDKFKELINTRLPEDIRLLDLKVVSGKFDPRKRAYSKIYRYQIWLGDVYPFFASMSWCVRTEKRFKGLEFDFARCQQACEVLVGEHDFASFCSTQAAKEKKSTVRRIFNYTAKLVKDCIFDLSGDFLVLEVEGEGFLQYQVRIMTASILEVAFGRENLDWLKMLLEVKDRRVAPPMAPPQGLFLWRVNYRGIEFMDVSKLKRDPATGKLKL